jgi:hypothetical protein
VSLEHFCESSFNKIIIIDSWDAAGILEMTIDFVRRFGVISQRIPAEWLGWREPIAQIVI